jgi:hypothetical protein
MYDVVARYLKYMDDPRKVIPNGKPQYFGGDVEHTSLVPAGESKLGSISFEKWLEKQKQIA